MFSWSNSLFYVVFLSQIILISYYFPGKMLARMQHVLDTYPPASYPRLYPRPLEHYKIAHLAFKYANRFIVVLGFLILFAVMFLIDHSTFADDGFISEAWPAFYGFIQFIPAMALELSEFGHLKLMRKSNPSSRRKADLRRRQLFDFASPLLIAAAVGLYLGCILFDLYVHGFAVNWSHDTVQRALVMTGTNLLLIAVGAWNLYGGKLDPHQSSQDRERRIGASVRSLLFVSMAMSVYIGLVAADDLYNLDFIDATLLSVYFQVIVFLSIGHFLNSIKPDEINFDVYRNDVPAT